MSFVIALAFCLLIGAILKWLPGYLYRLSDRSYFEREDRKYREKLNQIAAGTYRESPPSQWGTLLICLAPVLAFFIIILASTFFH